MAVHAPAKFVGLGGMDPSAPKGGDLLGEAQTSSVARPVIAMKGGKSKRSRRARRVKRKQTRRQHRHRKQRGGFLPSIGEGFAAAAAQYAAPIALLGLYKLFNKPTRKRSRSTRRR
jgi:hypothetical protein